MFTILQRIDGGRLYTVHGSVYVLHPACKFWINGKECRADDLRHGDEVCLTGNPVVKVETLRRRQGTSQ